MGSGSEMGRAAPAKTDQTESAPRGTARVSGRSMAVFSSARGAAVPAAGLPKNLGTKPAMATSPNSLAKNDFRDKSCLTVKAYGQNWRNKRMAGGWEVNKNSPAYFTQAVFGPDSHGNEHG